MEGPFFSFFSYWEMHPQNSLSVSIYLFLTFCLCLEMVNDHFHQSWKFLSTFLLLFLKKLCVQHNSALTERMSACSHRETAIISKPLVKVRGCTVFPQFHPIFIASLRLVQPASICITRVFYCFASLINVSWAPVLCNSESNYNLFMKIYTYFYKTVVKSKFRCLIHRATNKNQTKLLFSIIMILKAIY